MGTLRTIAVATVAASWALACSPNSTCSVRYEDSKRDDGGFYRCARPEDCPRVSNALVCTTDDQYPETECVSCTDSTCLRHIPVKCQ